MTILDSRRTVVQYVMDVMRETLGQCDPSTCHAAIKDAVKWIDQKGNYSFLQKEANLSISAPWRQGTISTTGGSMAVFGTGTAWNPLWTGRTLVFGGRLDYPIDVIVGPDTLMLRDPVAGDGVVPGQSYTLYANRYLLPVDCEPGRDIVLKGGSSWGSNGEIRKMLRPLHERRKSESGSSSVPQWYTDGELDEATNRPTILLHPYPTAATELRLLYYRSFSVPVNQNSVIMVPLAFERLIVLKASAILMARLRMQGWLEKNNEAEGMLGDLYNRHGASAAYDTQIEVDDGEGNLQGDVFQDSTYYPRGF